MKTSPIIPSTRFAWVRFDIRLAAMMIVALAVTGRTAVAAGMNACTASARAAATSCAAGARSDYQIAVGKCANIADAAARKDCQNQAGADLKDALDTCKAQKDARLAVCARLGSATYEPSIAASNFVSTVNNPFMPLVPGTTFVYSNSTGSNVVFVSHNVKTILGVNCVEVQDKVYQDGALTEDTLDWYAQDTQGNVWYFGENTHELEGNEIINIDGSFKAGVNGAQPGIIMKASPAVGDFYRQEFDLGNAEDVAEVVSLTNTVTVASGRYTNCLLTLETSPLEPDASEHKFYASGVGNVLVVDLVTGERLELVSVTTGP